MDAVTDEQPSRAAEVTDKPVESGQGIADHMKMKPSKVHLSGVMVNDAAAKLNILKNYQKDAKLLRYVGRNIFDNMVIERLDTDHGINNIEGYSYDITLVQVKIAVPETYKVKVKPPAKKPKKAAKKKRTTKSFKSKTKRKTNSGRKQPKKKKISKAARDNARGIRNRYNEAQANARAIARRIHQHGDL